MSSEGKQQNTDEGFIPKRLCIANISEEPASGEQEGFNSLGCCASSESDSSSIEDSDSPRFWDIGEDEELAFSGDGDTDYEYEVCELKDKKDSDSAEEESLVTSDNNLWSLPAECIEKIVSYLASDDVKSLTFAFPRFDDLYGSRYKLVCREQTWNNTSAIKINKAYDRIDIVGCDVEAIDLETYSTSRVSLEELNLSGCMSYEANLHRLLLLFPNIKKLSILNLDVLFARNVRNDQLPLFEHLTSLSLDNIRPGPIMRAFKSVKRLRKLKIKDIIEEPSNVLAFIGDQKGTLRYLTAPDHFFTNRLELSELEVLELTEVFSTNKKNFSVAPNLRVLKLKDIVSFKSGSFRRNQSSVLEKLVLSSSHVYIPKNTDRYLAHLPSLKFLRFIRDFGYTKVVSNWVKA